MPNYRYFQSFVTSDSPCFDWKYQLPQSGMFYPTLLPTSPEANSDRRTDRQTDRQTEKATYSGSSYRSAQKLIIFMDGGYYPHPSLKIPQKQLV